MTGYFRAAKIDLDFRAPWSDSVGVFHQLFTRRRVARPFGPAALGSAVLRQQGMGLCIQF